MGIECYIALIQVKNFMPFNGKETEYILDSTKLLSMQEYLHFNQQDIQ